MSNLFHNGDDSKPELPKEPDTDEKNKAAESSDLAWIQIPFNPNCKPAAQVEEGNNSVIIDHSNNSAETTSGDCPSENYPSEQQEEAVIPEDTKEPTANLDEMVLQETENMDQLKEFLAMLQKESVLQASEDHARCTSSIQNRNKDGVKGRWLVLDLEAKREKLKQTWAEHFGY